MDQNNPKPVLDQKRIDALRCKDYKNRVPPEIKEIQNSRDLLEKRIFLRLFNYNLQVDANPLLGGNSIMKMNLFTNQHSVMPLAKVLQTRIHTASDMLKMLKLVDQHCTDNGLLPQSFESKHKDFLREIRKTNVTLLFSRTSNSLMHIQDQLMTILIEFLSEQYYSQNFEFDTQRMDDFEQIVEQAKSVDDNQLKLHLKIAKDIMSKPISAQYLIEKGIVLIDRSEQYLREVYLELFSTFLIVCGKLESQQFPICDLKLNHFPKMRKNVEDSISKVQAKRLRKAFEYKRQVSLKSLSDAEKSQKMSEMQEQQDELPTSSLTNLNQTEIQIFQPLTSNKKENPSNKQQEQFFQSQITQKPTQFSGKRSYRKYYEKQPLFPTSKKKKKKKIESLANIDDEEPDPDDNG